MDPNKQKEECLISGQLELLDLFYRHHHHLNLDFLPRLIISFYLLDHFIHIYFSGHT